MDDKKSCRRTAGDSLTNEAPHRYNQNMENFSFPPFDKNAAFASKRLSYRGIREEDADRLIAWRSREDIYHHSGQPRPISRTEHLQWFSRYRSTPDEIRFLIVESATEKEIGLVGGACEKETCVLSYYIGEPDCRGKGYAREAIAAFMDYVHSTTGIETFEAHIREDNASSIACVRALGFTKKISPEDSTDRELHVYEYHFLE